MIVKGDEKTIMNAICFSLTVHAPARLRTDYSFFEIGKDHRYFDEPASRAWLEGVIARCWQPAVQVLYDLVRRHEGRFRFGLSLSGPSLRLMERHAPETLEAFRRLLRTGCVELIGETSHHSLAALHSPKEFTAQLALYRKQAKSLFDAAPAVFRNTELIYSDAIGRLAEEAGYKTVLAEGFAGAGSARSPQQIWQVAAGQARLLLRHAWLSEDLANRFSDRSWQEYPLSAEKYGAWLKTASTEGPAVNVFADIRALGEWNNKDSGIFDFLWHFPDSVLGRGLSFTTPSETAIETSSGPAQVPVGTSWAGPERDLTPWMGNPLQDSALQYLYDLEKPVFRTKDEDLIETWRSLQDADYFDWMCTRRLTGGTPYRQPSPFSSPYDAYVAFINMLNDFREVLKSGGVRV